MPKIYANEMNQLSAEIDKAIQRHSMFHNAHETLGVLWEEVDEYKAEVWKKQKKRNPAKMRKELLQIAAVCIKALLKGGDK